MYITSSIIRKKYEGEERDTVALSLIRMTDIQTEVVKS